jgi:hypothetical protein
MPAELASVLHMEEHRIDPMIGIESPYDSAPDKILAQDEIRRLRTAIAWSGTMPAFAFVDSLTILSPTNIVARQNSKKFMREYQLAKHGDRWVIESATRSPLHPKLPE